MTRRPSSVRSGIVACLSIAGVLAAVPAGSQVNVSMQHNDRGQTGANTSETILTRDNVRGPSFGRLFSLRVTGDIYAQVVVASGVSIGGVTHNVAYVATGHDMVHAFDADNGSELWSVSLAPYPEQTVPESVEGTHDIPSEVGVVGTPAIDAASNTLYVVAKTCNPCQSGGPGQILRLHALDLSTHAEKFGGPVQLSGSVLGSGDASVGGVVSFNANFANQRPGLTLANGKVYIAFASHGDRTPYHGWVLAYNATSLQSGPVAVFNASPNSGGAGIWMSGQAPIVDSSGNLYALTGNLILLTDTPGTDCPGVRAGDENVPGTYGESYIKLSGSNLWPIDYFKPFNAHSLDCVDADVSSGGAMEIPGAGYIVGGGKDGKLYVVNENWMGGFSPYGNNVAQILDANSGQIFSSPVWWNNSMYLWGTATVLKSWAWLGGQFNTMPTQQPNGIATPGGYSSNAQLAISASGTQAGTGVVWALAPQGDPNYLPPEGVQGILYAFDASNLNVLYSNNYGKYAKYAPPAIANGKVYVPTNTGEVVVFGLATPSGYLGCYTDDTNRALPNFLSSQNETVESCKQRAANAGFSYAGVQWYGQCFAGNNLGYTRVPDGQCNTLCTANTNEVCGGAYRNSIYRVDSPASIVSPTPGSTLPGSSVTFSWTTGSGVSQYYLYVGNSFGGSDIYAASQGLATSATVSNLPADGRTIYVRLWSYIPSLGWLWRDYTYTAAVMATPAAIYSPAPGSTLPGSSATFYWTPGSGVSMYYLYVGSSFGGFDIYAASQGLATAATVSNLPTDGRTIYVRLWSYISNMGWLWRDYTYTAAVMATPADIYSPAPGSTLAGSSATFYWTTGSGVSMYYLYVGTYSGGYDIYAAGQGLATSATVSNLPADGRTLYVRLWSYIPSSGSWLWRDYTYRAASAMLISNIIATYGGNCRAPYGNVTAVLASQCNGLSRCDYVVDYRIIGDPVPGCAKDYVAQWSCGTVSKSLLLPPEAGFGSIATLTCP